MHILKYDFRDSRRGYLQNIEEFPYTTVLASVSDAIYVCCQLVDDWQIQQDHRQDL